MAEYVIKEVIPKSGKMLEIHEEVLGRRCYILALEKNQRGFIKFEPSYDPGRLHRLHTSTVMDIIETEDGSQISIETANTTYVLERITENTALYNHGWQFSREEAMDDIIKYLSSQDEEYFAERETTKSKVLSKVQTEFFISGCCEDAYVDKPRKKKKGKRKTGMEYRRTMAIKHRDDLMWIINHCGYNPMAGYVDWDWVDGKWQPVGKYIKYPKNSNAQRHWKRYSNKIVRRSKEVFRGNQYRKCFDYWWTLY